MTIYPKATQNDKGGQDFRVPSICNLPCIETGVDGMVVHHCYFLEIKNELSNGACNCVNSKMEGTK